MIKKIDWKQTTVYTLFSSPYVVLSSDVDNLSLYVKSFKTDNSTIVVVWTFKWLIFFILPTLLWSISQHDSSFTNCSQPLHSCTEFQMSQSLKLLDIDFNTAKSYELVIMFLVMFFNCIQTNPVILTIQYIISSYNYCNNTLRYQYITTIILNYILNNIMAKHS